MSGHSKWHNIQAKKGKQDKIRGNTFTKIGKMITVAARQGGGDVMSNFSLRLAVEKAKEVNMPKENIERAIKRGTMELKDSAAIEEVVYEAFAPGGIAMIVEAMTDNKNRTGPEIKTIIAKHGGSVTGPGSVQWQFNRKGVVRFFSDKKNNIADWDNFQLEIMDAGSEDINESEEGVEIISLVENFQKVLEIVKKNKIDPEESGLEWIAKETIKIDENISKKVENLCNLLEDHDDVKAVYTNEF